MKKFSIMFLAIVPAYNEEKTIGSVVQGLFHHVDRVLVVDDGSADATAEAARGAGAVVLCHELNRGQGAALETGHEYARLVGAEYVLHFDADGQFDVADIGPAFEKLKNTSADVLFGSRFLDCRSNVPWIKRHVWLPLARLWHNAAYRTKMTDAHNGFRILNRRALDAIHITHDRMAHASEIPASASRLGLRIVEFPIRVVYREYGQGTTGAATIVRDLLLGRFIR